MAVYYTSKINEHVRLIKYAAKITSLYVVGLILFPESIPALAALLREAVVEAYNRE
jgi:hypothetical protein